MEFFVILYFLGAAESLLSATSCVLKQTKATYQVTFVPLRLISAVYIAKRVVYVYMCVYANKKDPYNKDPLVSILIAALVVPIRVYQVNHFSCRYFGKIFYPGKYGTSVRMRVNDAYFLFSL